MTDRKKPAKASAAKIKEYLAGVATWHADFVVKNLRQKDRNAEVRSVGREYGKLLGTVPESDNEAMLLGLKAITESAGSG